MKKFLPILSYCLLFYMSVQAQCPAGQTWIKVVLKTDQYPQETAWQIRDINQSIVLQSPAFLSAGTVYIDSICVPLNVCNRFTITDQAGDGICCGYGQGFFELFYNGVSVLRDSSFGAQRSIWMGCAPGENCSTALPIGQGSHTAPAPDTWYAFTAPVTGTYTVETCSMGNTCDTKLWMYDYCQQLVYDHTNAATIYYADNNCGADAFIHAFLTAGNTYYIRVGDAGNACAGMGIQWQINYNGSVTGCTDTAACNFNPFATISNAASCIYYPNPNCPTGADLIVDSTSLVSSLYMDVQSNYDICTIREGCMNGYGTRQLIRFDTKISNIGATDFYAGMPPSVPAAYDPIFEWDQCHAHWHFQDYAEYLLADQNNDFIPIGYKNGFCVMDLGCTTGSPKFGCHNMGITAGCEDIYHAGLDCQWIDITDIPDGSYKLILRANWIPRPDYYGRYETSYTNNWARACIELFHTPAGQREVQVLPNCAPYFDCMGTENGTAEKDCAGTCNGNRLRGDLNIDYQRNLNDVTSYLIGAIYNSIPVNQCNDLNADSTINIVDAGLLLDCVSHGSGPIPPGHAHIPCKYPNRIRNPFQEAAFSIGNLDYAAKTIDIFIKNPDSKVLGYQLKVKGVILSIVQQTIAGFNPQVQFRPSGEIIVLSSDEIPIPKNQQPVMVLRLQYTSIDSSKICIDSVIAVVNESYEEITSGYFDSVCLAAIPTPNNMPAPDHDFVHRLYPNPAGQSAILLMENMPVHAITLTLYDCYGRQVRSYPPQRTRRFEIHRETLSPGLYMLHLSGKHGYCTEKLVFE